MAVFINLNKELISRQFNTFFIVFSKVFFVPISKGTVNSNFFIFSNFNVFVFTVMDYNPKLFSILFFLTFLFYRFSFCSSVCFDIKKRNCFFYNKKVSFLSTFISGFEPIDMHLSSYYSLGVSISNLHKIVSFYFYYFPNFFSFKHLMLLFICRFYFKISFIYRVFISKIIVLLLSFLFSNFYYFLTNSLCHCDLFRDNVIFNSFKYYYFIDFHFLSFEKRLYDICIFINDWCFSKHFLHKKFIYFLIGYSKFPSNYFSSFEFDYFCYFLIFVSFRFLITRLSTSFFGLYIFSDYLIYRYYYLCNYFYFKFLKLRKFFSLLKRFFYVKFYRTFIN